MISGDINRVIISGATSSIGIALREAPLAQIVRFAQIEKSDTIRSIIKL